MRRVTVSLDALDQDVFESMSDTHVPLARVLEGIDAAGTAGLAPVKVNMVVKREVNDHCVMPMAEHFRGRPASLGGCANARSIVSRARNMRRLHSSAPSSIGATVGQPYARRPTGYRD